MADNGGSADKPNVLVLGGNAALFSASHISQKAFHFSLLLFILLDLGPQWTQILSKKHPTLL